MQFDFIPFLIKKKDQNITTQNIKQQRLKEHYIVIQKALYAQGKHI